MGRAAPKPRKEAAVPLVSVDDFEHIKHTLRRRCKLPDSKLYTTPEYVVFSCSRCNKDKTSRRLYVDAEAALVCNGCGGKVLAAATKVKRKAAHEAAYEAAQKRKREAAAAVRDRRKGRPQVDAHDDVAPAEAERRRDRRKNRQAQHEHPQQLWRHQRPDVCDDSAQAPQRRRASRERRQHLCKTH